MIEYVTTEDAGETHVHATLTRSRARLHHRFALSAAAVKEIEGWPGGLGQYVRDRLEKLPKP